jgi:hypothetical protein
MTQQGLAMSEIEQLEQRIQSLSPEELARFRAWFLEFDAKIWDQQIEADVKDGKLDKLIDKGVVDFKAGKATEL